MADRRCRYYRYCCCVAAVLEGGLHLDVVVLLLVAAYHPHRFGPRRLLIYLTIDEFLHAVHEMRASMQHEQYHFHHTLVHYHLEPQTPLVHLSETI